MGKMKRKNPSNNKVNNREKDLNKRSGKIGTALDTCEQNPIIKAPYEKELHCYSTRVLQTEYEVAVKLINVYKLQITAITEDEVYSPEIKQAVCEILNKRCEWLETIHSTLNTELKKRKQHNWLVNKTSDIAKDMQNQFIMNRNQISWFGFIQKALEKSAWHSQNIPGYFFEGLGKTFRISFDLLSRMDSFLFRNRDEMQAGREGIKDYKEGWKELFKLETCWKVPFRVATTSLSAIGVTANTALCLVTDNLRDYANYVSKRPIVEAEEQEEQLSTLKTAYIEVEVFDSRRREAMGLTLELDSELSQFQTSSTPSSYSQVQQMMPSAYSKKSKMQQLYEGEMKKEIETYKEDEEDVGLVRDPSSKTKQSDFITDDDELALDRDICVEAGTESQKSLSPK